MSINEREYLDSLVRQAEETCNLLSVKRKPERERIVCRALLRSIGLPLSESEIQSNDQDPPDVIFRSARFEVRQLLNHEQHKLWKEELARRKVSRALGDLLQPYSPPVEITWDKIGQLVVAAFEEKARNYGKRHCGQLDALLYFNIQDTLPALPFSQPALSELNDQAWRSVSVVSDTWSVVVLAHEGVPDFLRDAAGGFQSGFANLFAD